MSERLAFAFAVVALIVAPAMATDVATDEPVNSPPPTDAPDPIAGLYGNVVSVHNEQTGSDSTFAFQGNRTFLISVKRGDKMLRVGGLWAPNIDNSKICFQPSPLGGVSVPEMQGCLPLSGHVRGDQWQAVNASNQTVDISVSAPQ